MKAVCFSVTLTLLSSLLSVAVGDHLNKREAVPLTLEPWYGSVLGGAAVVISGPQFGENEDITCSFDGTTVEGKYLDATSALCVSPLLTRVGHVEVQLNEVFSNNTATFYSLPIDNSVSAVNFSMSNVFKYGDTIDLVWSPTSFISLEDVVGVNQESLLVDITMYEISLDDGGNGVMLTEIALLAVGLDNSGSTSVTVPSANNGNTCRSQTSTATVCTVVILVTIREGQSVLISGGVGLWTDIVYVSFKPPSTLPSLQLAQCQEWVNSTSAALGLELLDRVSDTPCPPRMVQAEAINSRLVRDTSSNLLSFFHPRATSCYHQQTFTSSNQGSGNRCCYESDGSLIVGPSSGGAVNKVAPPGAIRGSKYWSRLLTHQVEDVLPFIWCCKGERAQCSLYYEQRPSDNGSSYEVSAVGLLYGDPHMVTFDQHQYTFNGKGEFDLLKTESNLFTLQGRMTAAVAQNGGESLATAFSAIVAKQESSDVVQLQMVSDTTITAAVLVNGESISFDVLKSWQLNNVTVSHDGDSTITVLFSSGAVAQVQGRNGILSQILVSLPATYEGQTSGLFGSYNGDKTDDLLPQSGDNPLPLDSTTEAIHSSFGTSWIIGSEDGSLFTYSSGQSWADFYSPLFVPVFEATFTDSSLETRANSVCGDDQYCLFDVAATERVDVGEATKESGAYYQTLLSFSAPVSCNPSCLFGVCVANDTCACREGYEGNTCNVTVYSECSSNPCSNGGSCQYHAGTYICSCPPQYSGLFCDSRAPTTQAPADSETARLVGAIIGGVIISGVSLLCISLCTLGWVFSFDPSKRYANKVRKQMKKKELEATTNPKRTII